jgi:hypothetical protein
MADFEILLEFKTQILCFLDELIEQFPEEGDLILLRIMLKDQIQIVNVMNQFILEVLPLKNLIYAKDELFFLNNNILFGNIDKGKVNHFKKLWRSNKLDTSDKDVIWDWFKLFIKICEKYQKHKSIETPPV